MSSRDERANSRRRGKSGKAKPTPLWRRAFAARKSLPGFLLVAFAGVVAVGVPVNALFLQDGRRGGSTIALHAGPDKSANVQSNQPAAPLPQPRPSAIGTASVEPRKPEGAKVEATKATKSPSDAIGRLLSGGAPQKSEESVVDKDAKNKTVVFAQRALAKLGYSLHQDGVFGGTTRQAIEKFERSSGLPVKGELTPKILRLLGARSGVAFR